MRRHAARRLPQLRRKSAGAICKRRDAVRLGRQKALQRRERRTDRHPLLAGVGLQAAVLTLECHLSTMSALLVVLAIILQVIAIIEYRNPATIAKFLDLEWYAWDSFFARQP
jgi:hypothetical protein